MSLSEFTKGFIIGASKSGTKVSQILDLLRENNLKASKSSIYDIINSFDVDNRLLTPKKSSGHPKLIGENTGKKIEMEIENDRNLTATDIFKNKNINCNQVSYQTINNFINNLATLLQLKNLIYPFLRKIQVKD